MAYGICEVFVFHLSGTGGTILDAGKTDDAPPSVGNHGVVEGNRFRRTRIRALPALDTGIFIRFRRERNRFSSFLDEIQVFGEHVRHIAGDV